MSWRVLKYICWFGVLNIKAADSLQFLDYVILAVELWYANCIEVVLGVHSNNMEPRQWHFWYIVG